MRHILWSEALCMPTSQLRRITDVVGAPITRRSLRVDIQFTQARTETETDAHSRTARRPTSEEESADWTSKTPTVGKVSHH